MLKTYANRMLEERYDMAEEPLNAALFTTGNGYLGVRGSFEEFGSLRIQGAYIRGLIDQITEIIEPFCDNEYMKHYYIDEVKLKHFEKQDSIINFADILLLRISIAGETFYPWEGELLSWERYLDTQRACLVRNVVWKSPKGHITRLEFERFASSDNDHLYCMKVAITPVNHSESISVISGIDTRVKTNGQHVTQVMESSAEGNISHIRTRLGERFQFEIAATAASHLRGMEEKWHTYTGEAGLIANEAVYQGQEGKTVTAEKILYITSSRETDDLAPKIPEGAYQQFYNAHVEAYQKMLAVVDCKIEGDVEADGAVRFSNYHSIIAIARNDSIHGLSAKALTGEKYNNFVWWDSEIYQLPIYIYTMPEAAKQAILYRYNTLKQAKENARLEGRSGARYAFCSSVLGEERVWEYARHPFMQIHITADVAYGVIHYYTATGDKTFLEDYGLKIMVECCRYWMDRIDHVNGRCELRRVTGPDEHHPYVNNDAYTNYLVQLVLRKTAEYCKLLDGKEAANEEEWGKWLETAENLYLPMEDTGMIPQFDDYFQLSRTLEEAGGGAAKSFQMKASGLYHKSQIIKQPDVMLLFSYLNLPFDKAVYAKNWDYYEKMCESSSSLSFAPHAICSADNGRILSAYNYLLETAYIDIRDIHNCGWQGVHAGCAAGAWYAVFRGFGGIVCREDKIEINPCMIPWWKRLTFSFYFKGILLTVEMTNHTYILHSNGDQPVTVVFRGKGYEVSQKQKLECKI